MSVNFDQFQSAGSCLISGAEDREQEQEDPRPLSGCITGTAEIQPVGGNGERQCAVVQTLSETSLPDGAN